MGERVRITSMQLLLLGLEEGYAERRWVCQVFRSGYHNGATCGPSDPHDSSWRCEYRTEMRLSASDAQMERVTP